ncbi:nucleoside-binding protein [Stella humosa]|uniref:Nucleoside-binding protein n=1 Tax=Stella humosa TaxID=94 RepID=A0A3N1KXN9_9PROT|nr:BMP family ABC transporter substrate-binding protein [Stella humosa]ROP83350.1 nucleoside-binding protein [Stella humosa]
MFRLLPALLALLLAGPASAQTPPAPRFVPAIVFDIGGKLDKGFNEAGLQGAERYKRATGTAYREVELTLESDRQAVLRQLVEDGATLIVSMGFAQVEAVTAAAKAFPNIRFAIIDGVVEAPNVRSFQFKEQEGSFLAGVLAAMSSRTGKIGFIGGVDIPIIRTFACGYAQGARHAVPAIGLLQAMAGTTPAAWLDPARGIELANRQMDDGADVIFAAAGATGFGVLQATAGRHHLAIGVDSNQNHLHPGTILTSMVKRVDVAVHQALRSAADGTWAAGTTVLGLKEGGVGVVIDEYNRALITPPLEAAMKEATDEIVAGRLEVVDYRKTGRCPVE